MEISVLNFKYMLGTSVPGQFSCPHCLDQYLYSDTDLKVNQKASMGISTGANKYFIYLPSAIILAATPVKSLPRITVSSNTSRDL